VKQRPPAQNVPWAEDTLTGDGAFALKTRVIIERDSREIIDAQEAAD
jgi:hypothetical protein